MNAKTMRKNPKLIIGTALVLLMVSAVVLYVVFSAGTARDESDQAATATPSVPDNLSGMGGLAAYDDNGDGMVYQDGMHPWIVLDEPGPSPDCGMPLTPVRVDRIWEEGAVRIDPVTLQNIGVRTETVRVEPLENTVRTTGHFEADEQRTAVVSPKISGWVEKLYVDFEGARVAKGQPLLEIYSPELVSTQEEYLLALRHLERMEGTAGEEGARRLAEAARRRLRYWDISEAQIRQLEEQGAPQKTLTLYAPASGTVVSTDVVQGQQVTAGQSIMRLADLSRLWLMVDVYEQDLAWVERGTTAVVELPYQPGRTLRGRVDYIYDEVDPATRTLKARVTLPNPGLQIKPGMYATVTLAGGETPAYPTVPQEAVLRTGERDVVILALGDGRFRPAEVTPGMQSNGRVQILSGLQGGEQVVTSAQFLIDSEAQLQSAIGAMISGHDHGGMGRAGVEGRSAPQVPTRERIAEQEVQLVPVTVGASGFEPATITLQAGVPARLVFTRTTDVTCATQVQAPQLGIARTDLPLHEAVAVTFTPEEPGTFTFACGMDMLKGALIVAS